MSILFGRTARLVLASQLDPKKVKVGKHFFNAYTKRTIIENLRIRFTVEKTLGKDPNSATILVTNLAEKTRAEFETKPTHITLSAGFDFKNKLLYKGDVKNAESFREGPDWITQITCGTGQHALSGARTSFSFGKGTSPATMVDKVLKGMGLKMPTNFEEGKEFINTLSGKTISGPSVANVQKLVGPSYQFSIQDDVAVILKENGVRFAAGTRVSQDTGMIGIPTLSPPKHKGGKPVVLCKTFINGDIQAGGFITLDTLTVNGDFKNAKVTHTGDTHGQEWYTSVEGPKV